VSGLRVAVETFKPAYTARPSAGGRWGAVAPGEKRPAARTSARRGRRTGTASRIWRVRASSNLSLRHQARLHRCDAQDLA